MALLLREKGHELSTPARAEFDLDHPHVVEKFFKDNAFDVLINCAAFTRVDACEENAKQSMAWNVNATAVGWMAQFCRKMGRKLVHFSTDYVFDGTHEEPYMETDKPAPLNVYGKTKLEGERLIQDEDPFFYIIRTSWLYGRHGQHFVGKMIELLKTKPRIEVVDDQVGGPTHTEDLAQFTLEMLEKNAQPGIYHFSNEGRTSWFSFTKEIQRQTWLTACEVVPVKTERVFRPATRPLNSRFDLTKSHNAVGHDFRTWQEALKDYLAKEYGSARA